MTKISYTKHCSLPTDLILLLKERGLSFVDEKKAINYLTNIGYFRLSAYLRPLYKEPKSAHIFKVNATFEKVMAMYRFDRKLRILLFNEIEKIEVAIRSAMSDTISRELANVFWMTDRNNFSNQYFFDETLNIITHEIGKTKEEFILHFKKTYSNPYPPAWMIAEILPLGVICRIYQNLKKDSLKKKIARQFGLNVPVMTSWILVLGNLRNYCGHHSRIWNREMAITPSELRNPMYNWIDTTKTDNRRLYCRISIIKYYLCSVSPENTFKAKLKDLFTKFPTIDSAAMGFPEDWESESLWAE
ncbi:Abi family protein [Parabacteroides sp. PF5-6]|uniref:Abi family protein n=1 Tax=Parabacteroides sp. PF5-6 TaxID=1742403 RepID=UPI00240732BE|nr:Abi family protein [Parabacteroides sp. PF5-6]MDF9829939.1 abortive infection bacteriophage resistance protein [Parabacteroides sp. PF5-6]